MFTDRVVPVRDGCRWRGNRCLARSPDWAEFAYCQSGPENWQRQFVMTCEPVKAMVNNGQRAFGLVARDKKKGRENGRVKSVDQQGSFKKIDKSFECEMCLQCNWDVRWQGDAWVQENNIKQRDTV